MNRAELYLNTLAKTRAATAAMAGNDLEHHHRAALQKLLEAVLGDGVVVINEPGKEKLGAPDLKIVKNNYPIGNGETKRLGENLDGVAKSEQLKRYFGYANLILTNYLEFRFYKHGKEYGDAIVIADLETLALNPTAFAHFETTLHAFLREATEPVQKAGILAQIMGERGKRLRNNLVHFLESADERVQKKNKPILEIYNAFRSQLVHDLDLKGFADMYTQTLVYGLFVARYHDKTEENFSRQEARDLIPQTNPLLHRFFDHIAGADFDERLKPIVDELCTVFGATKVRELMQQIYKQDLWGSKHAGPDPVIHFYEDFLKNYDSEQRKEFGTYYTPPAVVSFIVRSVDEILKRDFALFDGLADTSKIEVPYVEQGMSKKMEVHRVQVLDPATGTGTFLNEVIRLIRNSFGEEQRGRFASYVRDGLLPRLHGFELMMAPYTIAHLKLAATLRESGAIDLQERIGVYLTNSLEKGIRHGDTLFGFGFAKTISEEGDAAARIKNDMPIMAIVGNPPYKAVSSNETADANLLVEKYKVEPGGAVKLQERKHWLNDDYVKFIALSENMIARSGYGVVGMITNNGFLDNPTFRGMRWHLMQTFDDIYVLDLHGNAKRKEAPPDGGKDENVFSIMQGVCILLAVKTGKKRKNNLATVHHSELWGRRADKLTILDASNVFSEDWQQLVCAEPYYFFLPKNTKGQSEYEKGFKIDDIFPVNVTGIVTMGDSFIVNKSKDVIADRVKKLAQGAYTAATLNHEFGLGKNYAKFVLDNAPTLEFDESKLVKINYRPFDNQWTYFDNKVLWRWREKVMRHFIEHKNIGLIISRQAITDNYSHVQVSRYIVDNREQYSNKGIPLEIPLYLYAEDGSRVPNLNHDIVGEFTKLVGEEPSPEDLFYYVYAVLHSPSYRAKYKEFLRIDFPRVVFPKDKKQFASLARFGEELCNLHLFESSKVGRLITSYPVDGLHEVEKVRRVGDKVFINKTQYFGGVPETAWGFYIGGYQPVQKWLKDRVGQMLTSEEIEYYQKIVVVVVDTARIMDEIDKAVQL